ncbi:hypothetical protein TNCT_106631 [Trichonephila clavata]|uniref:Uncharacterized protein n=1 Tax=Trichonephila clavata TaxID=2740835 RepID=A0A8X6GTJ6_TRICU|nr:hypothetical protein TNCT_106631 [Trichonephila clavata]
MYVIVVSPIQSKGDHISLKDAAWYDDITLQRIVAFICSRIHLIFCLFPANIRQFEREAGLFEEEILEKAPKRIKGIISVP